MPHITPEDRSFFTQQIFLIGTNNEDGSENFAPISWVSFTGGPPRCLVISIRGDKQTPRNLARTGVLSAALLTRDLIPFAEQCNSSTKRQDASILRPASARGRVLDVPVLQNAVWTYECEVIHTVPIGECHTYFAAVRDVRVAPEIEALDYLDLCAIDPVVYSPMHYYSIGTHLGKIGDFS